MAFLGELNKFNGSALKKAETKEMNWGEALAGDQKYWEARSSLQQIVDNVYITSKLGAKKEDELIQLGITHILVAAKNLKPDFPERFKYKQIDIMDLPEENILVYFKEVFAFFQEALENKRGILVYCNAGVSRSASFVAAWLIHAHYMSFEDALALMCEKREVEPNPGFVKQLKLFEEHGFDALNQNTRGDETYAKKSVSSTT